MVAASPGEVDITLDGKTVTLRPTLEASMQISARFGGCLEAYHGLGKFDITTYIGVVAAALKKDPGEVQNMVFDAGMDSLNKPLQRFVSRLSNGGREPISVSAEVESRVRAAAIKFLAEMLEVSPETISGPENFSAVLQIADAVRPIVGAKVATATLPPPPAAADAEGNA